MNNLLKVANIIFLILIGVFLGWLLDNRRNYIKLKKIMDSTEESISRRFFGFIKK